MMQQLDTGISIHPSRVGWDWIGPSAGQLDPTFQSTHPVWDGTKGGVTVLRDGYISIHPSRVGWDDIRKRGPSWISISIHPSRVGWDRSTRLWGCLQRQFQSTHPVWDGTAPGLMLKAAGFISIHPSRVGWDINAHWISRITVAFQSTHPVWDGTFTVPLEKEWTVFQSTHPVWDGTCACTSSRIGTIFQSTHPVWDGTARMMRITSVIAYFNPPIPCGMGLLVPTCWHDTRIDFNPPIPCGMGLVRIRLLITANLFQSTHPVWDGTLMLHASCHCLKYFNPPIPCGMGRRTLDR